MSQIWIPSFNMVDQYLCQYRGYEGACVSVSCEQVAVGAVFLPFKTSPFSNIQLVIFFPRQDLKPALPTMQLDHSLFGGRVWFGIIHLHQTKLRSRLQRSRGLDTHFSCVVSTAAKSSIIPRDTFLTL